MSLHLNPIFLDSLIKECLNIESIEYGYFIPILAEKAEFLGDLKLTSTCNLMSQQVKQYFKYIAYVHLYMSKKQPDLKKQIFFSQTYNSFDQNIKLESKKYSHPNSEIQGQKLQAIHEITNKIKLENKSSFLVNLYNIEKNESLTGLRDIDKKSFEILKNIQKTLDTQDISSYITKKSFPNNGKFAQNQIFFLLLKNLQYRKLWKANKWYPLVAKIAYDQQMINIYHNFMQMSTSERNMSNLLMQLCNEI